MMRMWVFCFLAGVMVLASRPGLATGLIEDMGAPDENIHVKQASIVIEKSDPLKAHIQISGDLAAPCIPIAGAQTVRDGHVFTVVVRTHPPADGVTCPEVETPFAWQTELDIDGLQAGQYDVIVNEARTSFTLPADHVSK